MEVVFFHWASSCGYSITRSFAPLIEELKKSCSVKEYRVPYAGANPVNLLRNILFVRRHRTKTGINHVTGDIHYCILGLIGAKSVLTIHDDYAIIKAPNWLNRIYKWLFWIYLPVKLADKTLCITEATRKKISRYVRSPKMCVFTHHALAKEYTYSPHVFNKQCPRILQIGTDYQKNLESTLEAVAQRKCHLRVLGRMLHVQSQRAQALRIDYSNACQLSDSEIIEEYKAADMVVFPSLYEGFGMPIIEAQAIGRALITSDLSPMNWVAGKEAALLQNPQDVVEYSALIERLIADDAYREGVIGKGRENVQRFSADAIAAEYVHLCRSTLDEASGQKNVLKMEEIKNLIFWGNVGVHVYPLIAALSLKTQVFMVIDKDAYDKEERTERKARYVPSSSLHIIDFRSHESIDAIISLFDADCTVHVNGAFKRTGSFESLAARRLMKRKATVVSLPQEGFQFDGLKKWINLLKWRVYINVLFRRVVAFGLTGENAFRDFRRIGCRMNRCFPFMYVTEPPVHREFVHNSCFRVIFVGAIDTRKNIRPIIRTLLQCSSLGTYEFHVYGGYGDVNSFKDLIKDAPGFFYHGIVPNAEVREAMQKSDLLLLPSLHDGYGAVVNEGLQCGCKILVSNHCGSEFLIRHHPEFGYVFDVNDLSDFREKFHKLLAQGPLSKEQKERIADWSKEHISPTVVADYCLKALSCFVGDGQKHFPEEPWKDY